MKKNGFTLMELISVIALMSLLFVIMAPKINDVFKESRADQLEEVRQMVVDATDVYLNNTCGRDVYNNLIKTEEVKIYLNVISECGLIEDKIYNPVSGDNFIIDNEYIVARIDEVGMIEYELSF